MKAWPFSGVYGACADLPRRGGGGQVSLKFLMAFHLAVATFG
jgi:hypothetical protein